MIQMVDLQLQYQNLRESIEPAVLRAMAEAAYIKGPQVGAFEKEFAAWLGTRHAIGVANGTDALHMAMRALGIGPGDEVITTAFSFIATSGTISMCGATPVFVDIEEGGFNLDPDAVEAAVTPRTRAILPVHLYGAPARMDRIMDIARRHGLSVVEDCAQAAGARFQDKAVGTIGTVGCFSFFPSKNLGCFGDGGMVVTDDDALAARLRAIGSHGSMVKYRTEILGFNSRLDTLQAAVLQVKLPHLDGWNEGRRRAAQAYSEALAQTGLVLPQPVPGHVYHQYTVRLAERDAMQKALQAQGIASMVYYPLPLHLQPLYDQAPGQHPRAEAAAREVLSLPMYPELTAEQVERVASTVREALGAAVR
jgi:dTDP-4-amino-4,6-dideoxygalactose transaminase